MLCCCTADGGENAEIVAVPLYPKPEDEPLREEPKQPPPPQAFEITLDKGHDRLGINTDARAFTLMVTGVNPGVVQKHNQASEAIRQVHVNDFIVMVNGVSDPEQMIEELRMQTKLSMKVQHVVPFTATFSKAGKVLGMKLSYHEKATTIGITEVGLGAVEDYNKVAPAYARIKPKDRIMSVGGVRGHAGRMLDALKTADPVELEIASLSP